MGNYDIIFGHLEREGKDFVSRIEGSEPLFICTIATTETAKIPGLSAAGAMPEITDYTPPADVELLYYGRCRCIDGVPVTPDGIPTPALITMSALRLSKIPCIVVNGGLRVTPKAPFFDVGGNPGRDIRTGKAVEGPGEVFERSRLIGRQLSKLAGYVVVGESIPGGTTTALAVLMAMGVDARRKVSSSMPGNPHDLKLKVVDEAFKAAGISFGSLEKDPLKAVSCVGDPMMPAAAGLISGAAEEVPVLMAGGTQMCAVLNLIKYLSPGIMGNLAIGTTRWILEDKSSDIKEIASRIAPVPILAAKLDFSESRFSGLRAYEKGVAKEGVGAGGSSIAAMVSSGGSVTKASLLGEIEGNYEMLTNAPPR
ncbi:MAG: TIGR00303 family protein [Candidatus Verstraetearchaeota archaeon]|nr:TIGR00303 family protein [Candidatus Verstraetearchaeota archaeon]